MTTAPTRAIKRFVPRSLLGRSLLIIVTPIILLQIVATVIFFDRHWDTVTRRLAGGVAGEIAMIAEILEREGPEARAWAFHTVRGRMNLQPRYIAGAGADTAWGTYGRVHETLADALRERVRQPFLIRTVEPERDIEVLVRLDGAVLAVNVPRKRLFSTTIELFLMWMIGTSVVLVVVATIFMRNQVKPIRRLAAATDAFGKGRDAPPFKLEGAAEVRQAGAAFNAMRERLQRHIAQRTEMLAGVSHDLRTPLTRLRLQLAMLGDRAEVAELARDVDEMERMVEGYLAFARGEGTEAPVALEIDRVLEEVVADARRAGAAIDLHNEGPLVASVRPEALRRCLANVIGNAARFAGHVAVRAGRRGEAIEIVIDDDGPGIPAAHREEVFKPFVRLDRSRNPETGGTGLGLTIARDVMRAHGGEVTLEDAPTGGLRVRLRLPV